MFALNIRIQEGGGGFPLECAVGEQHRSPSSVDRDRIEDLGLDFKGSDKNNND